MATESYEIVVRYEDSQGSVEENPNREARKTGQSQSAMFASVRTKRASHGVDILGNIKAMIGDKVYNGTLSATGNSKLATQNKIGTTMGIIALTDTAKSIGKNALSHVGQFTSNDAYQNSVDNIGSLASFGIGAGFSIAQGANMGGWIGAAVAVLANAVKVALDAGNRLMDYDRQSKINEAQSQRTRDRLGYIEAGYSR